mgnify:FL=1
MFFYYKKILAIIISFFYILVNYNFYNSIYHEYTNAKIFNITLWLGIVEVFFWIMLLYSVFYLENKSISNDSNGKTPETIELEEKKDIRDLLICFALFLISLVCVNISRVILQSSPYMNDVVSTVNSYVLFFGGTRVLFIFSAIVFGFIAWSRRNIFLLIISLLNGVVSVMIWLDFDGNITAIIRIIIAILAIGYYILLKNIIKYSFKQTGNPQLENVK